MTISTFDIIVIAVYLIGITAFGIWIGFRRHASTDHYFLANKSLGWFTVGAAVFTSNISTIHLVGLAAGGAKDGMVIGNFEWMACFTLDPAGAALRSVLHQLGGAHAAGVHGAALLPVGADVPGVHRSGRGAVDSHRHQPVCRREDVRELSRHADDHDDHRALAVHRHLHGPGRAEGGGDDREHPGLPAAGRGHARDGAGSAGAAGSRRA